MKKINHSLNVLKFFAMFGVICIHTITEVTNSLSLIIIQLSSCAVLIFFMISGFYSYYEDNSKATEKYKTRLIRLVILTAISNILYLFVSTNVIRGLLANNYLIILTRVPSLFDFLILNIGTAFHLWFLFALLYCYILLMILLKLNVSPKKLYILIPVLLLINLFLGEFLLCNGITVSLFYYRNFLLTGLPFFMLGYFIHNKYDKIIPKISNKQLFGLLILVLCFFIIELSITKTSAVLNVSCIFLTLLLFIYCVKNPNTLNLKVIGWIGGTLYAYIYILHPIAIRLMKWINAQFLNVNSSYLLSVETFISTIVISYIIYLIIKRLRSFVNKRSRT